MGQKSHDLGRILDLKISISLRSKKGPEVEMPDVKFDSRNNRRTQFDFPLSTSGPNLPRITHFGAVTSIPNRFLNFGLGFHICLSTSGLSIRAFHFGSPEELKTLQTSGLSF